MAQVPGTSTMICFNCGALGHGVATCPKPKDEAAIKARRDLILNSQKKGGQGSGDSSKGRPGGGGRGGGRGGRGDGGCGRGGGRGKPKGPKNPDKAPPKAGESHKKVVNGTTKFWCGRCGSWGDHSTENHPSSPGGDSSNGGGNGNSNGGTSGGGSNGDSSSSNNGETNLATTLSFSGATANFI